MATVGTNLATETTSSTLTTITIPASGDFTPAAGDLLVVMCAAAASVAANPTCNDSQGHTYTLIERATWIAGSTLFFWVCDQPAAAVATTVTVVLTGDSCTSNVAVVGRVAGMVRAGASAVRQFKSISNQASGGTPAVTFDSSCLTGNPTIAFVAAADSSAPVATEPNGWTERADQVQSTPSCGLEYASRDSGFTGATITWGSTAGGGWGAIVVEFDASVNAVTKTAVAAALVVSLVEKTAAVGAVLSSYVEPQTAEKTGLGTALLATYNGPAAMPLVSRGLSAFSGPDAPYGDGFSGPEYAVDADYETAFMSGTVPTGARPQWIALDISGLSSKSAIRFAWFHENPASFWIDTQPTWNLIGAYTIDAHAGAGGGSPPAEGDAGWVNLVTVASSNHTTRTHDLDLTGKNWVRMRASAYNANDQGDHLFRLLSIDLYDISGGGDDQIIFIGDSITAQSFAHTHSLGDYLLPWQPGHGYSDPGTGGFGDCVLVGDGPNYDVYKLITAGTSGSGGGQTEGHPSWGRPTAGWDSLNITDGSCHWAYSFTTTRGWKNVPEMINDARDNYPIQIVYGRISYTIAEEGETMVSRVISDEPHTKILCINMGMNDGGTGTAVYDALVSMVNSAVTAGYMAILIATVNWTLDSAHNTAMGDPVTGPTGCVNRQIAAARDYLRSIGKPVYDGPDFWTRFYNHPELIRDYRGPGVGSEIHPSPAGNLLMREMWTDTLLDTVYLYDTTPGPVERTATAVAAALIASPTTNTASATALLITRPEKTAAATAAIASRIEKTGAATAAIASLTEKTGSATAALAQLVEKTAAAFALLRGTVERTATVTAMINAPGAVTKTATASALLAQTTTRTAAATAALAQTVTQSAAATAALAVEIAKTASVLALLKGTVQKTAAAGAVLSSGEAGTYQLPSQWWPTPTEEHWDPGILEDTALGLPLGSNRLPVRAAIYATIQPSGLQNSTDYDAITDALGDCPENQVVKLGGDATHPFYITSPLIIPTKRVLRGSGAGVTRLVGTGANFTYESSWNPVVKISSGADGYTASRNFSAQGNRGDFTISFSGGNPGYAVGELVLIDQTSNSNPNIFWGTQADGPPNGFPRDYWTRADRAIGQLLEVASSTSNTVTFTTPLHYDYPLTYTPQISRLAQYDDGPTVSKVEYAGVEDLTVEHSSGSDQGGVVISGGSNCWIARCEISGGMGFFKLGVYKWGAYRCVLRDSYCHDAYDINPGGQAYGITLDGHSSNCLVENNISYHMNKVMGMRASGGGNVIAYNYMDYGTLGAESWIEVGLNPSHLTGAHYELFEGNYGFNYSADDTWGNALNITIFRNHLSGKDKNVTGDFPYLAAGMMTYHWWHAFVGNVLGYSGQTGSFTYEEVYPADESGTPYPMWKLGYSNGFWGDQLSQLCRDRTLRDGNYDYYSNQVHWHGLGGYGVNNGLTPPENHTLPDSLYLTEKPAFFGNLQWPWVDAAGTRKVYTLPAKARFDAGKPLVTTDTILPTSMELISRTVPATSSAGTASEGQDASYGGPDYGTGLTSAQVGVNGWLAYNLSGVAAAKRRQCLVALYMGFGNAQWQINFHRKTGGAPTVNTADPYGVWPNVPLGYKLQAGNDGSSWPKDLITVTSNSQHYKVHLVDLSDGSGGYYSRIRILTTSCPQGGAYLNMDVYDASGGVTDGFALYGDSITSNLFSGGEVGEPPEWFSKAITAARSGVFPFMVGGGMPGMVADDAIDVLITGSSSGSDYANLLDAPVLTTYNLPKYAALIYGMNDANGDGQPVIDFRGHYQTLINAIRAHGQIAVVTPTIWANDSAYQNGLKKLWATIGFHVADWTAKSYTASATVQNADFVWNPAVNRLYRCTTSGSSGTAPTGTGTNEHPNGDQAGWDYWPSLREDYAWDPGVIGGPDLYTTFFNHPTWLDGTNIHPSATGEPHWRDAWVNWALSTLYPPPEAGTVQKTAVAAALIRGTVQKTAAALALLAAPTSKTAAVVAAIATRATQAAVSAALLAGRLDKTAGATALISGVGTQEKTALATALLRGTVEKSGAAGALLVTQALKTAIAEALLANEVTRSAVATALITGATLHEAIATAILAEWKSQAAVAGALITDTEIPPEIEADIYFGVLEALLAVRPETTATIRRRTGMAQLQIALYSDDCSLSAVLLQPGETLDVGLNWDVAPVSVSVKVKQGDRVVYSAALADISRLRLTGSVTQQWTPKRDHRVELWATDNTGVVRSGSFKVSVGA